MIGDVPNGQSLCRFHVTHTTYTQKNFLFFNRLRRIRKKGPRFFFSLTAKKRRAIIFFACGEKYCAPKIAPRGGCCTKRLCWPRCCARATAQQLLNALVSMYFGDMARISARVQVWSRGMLISNSFHLGIKCIKNVSKRPHTSCTQYLFGTAVGVLKNSRRKTGFKNIYSSCELKSRERSW